MSFVSILGVIAPLVAGAASPAEEPAAEPGAAKVRHASYSSVLIGEGATSYWLFEPLEPRPESAPVVAFLHGWMATNPGIYGAWIEHLAADGHVVIFPRYQQGLRTNPNVFLSNALRAIEDAFFVLETSPNRSRPDRDRFAVIGHSAGGMLAARIAAVATDHELPAPKAVMSMMPADVLPIDGPDLARIPETTAFVVLVGEEDWFVGDEDARRIFAEAASVPPENKAFVYLRSVHRLRPGWEMHADHVAPTGSRAKLDSGEGPLRKTQMAMATVNRLDVEVLWRLADLAMAAGFTGRPLTQAERNGQELDQIGRRLERPPVMGQDLAEIPRVRPTRGIRVVRWPKPSFFDPFAQFGGAGDEQTTESDEADGQTHRHEESMRPGRFFGLAPPRE